MCVGNDNLPLLSHRVLLKDHSRSLGTPYRDSGRFSYMPHARELQTLSECHITKIIARKSRDERGFVRTAPTNCHGEETVQTGT